MHVRCPHCHNPIELVDDASLSDIPCSSCGSTFSLVGDLATTLDRPAEGKTIGHFQLVQRLGLGAFGEVWRANDLQLERAVAMKIPRKGQLDPRESEQFLREARAGAQLRHPNIVRVHEVGGEDGQVYIVSDLVEGVTLADRLTTGPLSSREAAELCAKIADALHHAHAAGVVHRDLKPSNIMLDADGQPHVMDFGLAKRDTGEITMTVEGQLLGTPAYMPPEQAQGSAHDADQRSDVYSLGVILFELLTGEWPFRGNKRMLLHQVIHDDAPRPRSLNSNIPRDLETICLKCLEKDPRRRYATAQAMGDDLRHFLAGEPVAARPIGNAERGWRWVRRHPASAGILAAATIALCAVFGLAVAVGYQSRLKHANEALIAANSQLEAARDEARTAQSAAERARQEAEKQRGAAEELAIAEADAKKAEQAQRQKAESLAAAEREAKEEEVAARLEAERARDEARKSRGERDKVLYLRRVSLAHAACEDTDILRARRLLDECAPEFRHWEWYYVQRLCHGASLTLKGHQKSVRSVAFSSDGTVILSGSDDRSIKLWDAGTGREIRTLDGHVQEVSSVAMSADGKRVVSGSHDETVKVWETETGRNILTLEGHIQPVTCVAISPDDKHIVSASSRNVIKIWDAETGQEVNTLAKRSERVINVQCVAFEPAGKQIVSGSTDTMLRLWDVQSGQETRVLQGHTSSVNSVAFSPDGRSIVSGSSDKTVKVWNAGSGAETLTLNYHSGPVTCVAFSPDGRWIVSGGWDKTLNLWDYASSRGNFTFKGHTDDIWCAAFSPDSQRLVSGGLDNTVKVWNVYDRQEFLAIDRYAAASPVCVAFCPEGKRFVTGGTDKVLKVWDVETGRETLAIDGHNDLIRSVAFSPDGKRMISGGDDKTINVWDAQDGHRIFAIEALPGKVNSVVFSPDGKRIVGACQNLVIVWDAESGEKTNTFDKNGTSRVMLSPDGKQIATERAHALIVSDLKTGDQLLTLRGHKDILRSAAFSPDGTRIVTGSNDTVVRVWEASTGDELLTLNGHTRAVSSVAFSPDGERIISTGEDKKIKLWDVATGQEILTLDGDPQIVTMAVFSHDGKRIASVGGDGVRLWTAAGDWKGKPPTDVFDAADR